jgi:hypothetical protein
VKAARLEKVTEYNRAVWRQMTGDLRERGVKAQSHGDIQTIASFKVIIFVSFLVSFSLSFSKEEDKEEARK